MMYTLNVFKQDKRVKAGERRVGSYTFDRKDAESMDREVKELTHDYPSSKFRIEYYEKYKMVKNYLTGELVQEDVDTPYFCSVASESRFSN